MITMAEMVSKNHVSNIKFLGDDKTKVPLHVILGDEMKGDFCGTSSKLLFV